MLKSQTLVVKIDDFKTFILFAEAENVPGKARAKIGDKFMGDLTNFSQPRESGQEPPVINARFFTKNQGATTMLQVFAIDLHYTFLIRWRYFFNWLRLE